MKEHWQKWVFFPNFEFTPVFPPIDESTWPSKVEGIFIKFIPLLTILATKDVKSPITPPPKAIKTSVLLKFLNKHFSTSELTFWKDFNFIYKGFCFI